MSRRSFALAALWFVAGSAFAQFPISIGVKGGLSLTDAFQNNSFSFPNSLTGTIVVHNYSPSKDYVVGPFVELRLPFGLGVEADGLYRPQHFSTETILAGTTPVPYSERSNSWEFPILAKYRFKLPIARPYIDAGPSFRTTGAQTSYYLSNHGFSAGAGVHIKALLLYISPEIRYTRWGADAKFLPGTTPLYSNVNQVELLVGIAF